MKKAVFTCDVCKAVEEKEIIGESVTGNPNRSLRVYLNIFPCNEKNNTHELRVGKELCKKCEKQMIEELNNFLIDNKYFY